MFVWGGDEGGRRVRVNRININSIFSFNKAEDTEILTDKQTTKRESYHLGRNVDVKEDGWKEKKIETVMGNYELDNLNPSSQDQKHLVDSN